MPLSGYDPGSSDFQSGAEMTTLRSHLNYLKHTYCQGGLAAFRNATTVFYKDKLLPFASVLTGALEETRTPTPLSTATSTLRVYQFHHRGLNYLFEYADARRLPLLVRPVFPNNYGVQREPKSHAFQPPAHVVVSSTHLSAYSKRKLVKF